MTILLFFREGRIPSNISSVSILSSITIVIKIMFWWILVLDVCFELFGEIL